MWKRVAQQKVTHLLRRVISAIVTRIPTDLKMRMGQLLPYFPIPRNLLGQKFVTYGTLYQLALHIMGFEDGLAAIDEPITANMVDRLGASDVFVDIGANVGLYTLLAAKRCELVVAIEPGRKQFRSLLRNIKLNGLKNVACVNHACWDREASLPFYHNILSHGWDSLVRKYPKSYEVSAKAVDDILAPLEVSSVTLIKVDAEGAELKVLRGAQKVLRKASVVIVELHENVDPLAVQEILSASGFLTNRLHQHKSLFVVGRKDGDLHGNAP